MARHTIKRVRISNLAKMETIAEEQRCHFRLFREGKNIHSLYKEHHWLATKHSHKTARPVLVVTSKKIVAKWEFNGNTI
jgi:hypothetical protein